MGFHFLCNVKVTVALGPWVTLGPLEDEKGQHLQRICGLRHGTGEQDGMGMFLDVESNSKPHILDGLFMVVVDPPHNLMAQNESLQGSPK